MSLPVTLNKTLTNERGPTKVNFFLDTSGASGILVPQSETEPMFLAVRADS